MWMPPHQRIRHITVNRVLAEQPHCPHDRRNGEVHPARIIRILRRGLASEIVVLASNRIRETALIKDSRLSGWPHLPERGIDNLPKERAKSAVPIRPTARNLQLASSGIVLHLDITGNRSLHRMTDVIHLDAVAIVPAVHVEVLQ